MKVVFASPFLTRPTEPFIKALSNTVPAIEAMGWEHGLSQAVGNPYISCARADMTRKALDANADVIVYLDYDVSWRPEDMVKLLSIDLPVVAGTYRFKDDEIRYMATVLPGVDGQLQYNEHGCVKVDRAPAGFLKVTRGALQIFARKHPHLLYGDPLKPHIDIFNHGAHEGVWWGEDYAFCRRWAETGNDMWIYPDLNIDHHSPSKTYKGNFLKHLKGCDI